jgi:hypothetical protein
MTIGISFTGLASNSAAVAASPKTTVNQGESIEFTLAQMMGSNNFNTYSKDCTPSSYSFSIKNVELLTVEYKSQAFNTEQCISSTTAWKGLLGWDTKECDIACINVNGVDIANAGTYTVEFNITLGVFADVQLSNTFKIDVLPAQFYSITPDSLKIYPYSDDYLDQVAGTIVFWDGEGMQIEPPKTTIGYFEGTKKLSQGTVQPDNTFGISVPAAKTGAGVLKVVSIENGVGGRKWVDLGENQTIKLLPTVLTSLSFSVTNQIYPNKDGYLDTGYIGITAKSNSDSQVLITGEIKVTKNGRLIKSYKLSHSKYSQFTWDGKDNGRVVAGTYLISASAKGPQGNAVKSSTSIKVGTQKWQTTTITKTYGAYTAADESQGDSYDPIDTYGSQGVRLYSSGEGDTMIVKLSLPINPNTVKWRISFNDWETTDGFFLYNPCTSSDCLSDYVDSLSLGFSSYDSGSSTWTKWAYIPGSVANFSIGSNDWASIYIDSFTIQYETKVFK